MTDRPIGMISGIHHVSVTVADTARALAFYGDVLGLVRDPQRPDLGFDGAWLQAGAQQIHLLELPTPEVTAARPEHVGRDRHIALAVTDLARVAEALERAGVPFSRSRSGRAALFCRDPDGNGIELMVVAQG